MHIDKGMLAALVLLIVAQPLHAADETAQPSPSEPPSTSAESAPSTTPPAPQPPPQDDTKGKESESSDPGCE